MKRIALALLLCLTFVAVALADVPYLQKVKRADEMIFPAPSYDECAVGTVRVAGTYTIVEEVDDGEGHLWGRLKSGAGWIDLTHVRSEEIAAWPVSVALAEHCPPKAETLTCTMEDSEYTTWIIFRTSQPLTDVALLSLNMAADEGVPAEVLASWPSMSPDMPLQAGVVFYGDMTTYALLCTDADGGQHVFPVTVSGRNGMLLLDHWTDVSVLDIVP